MMSAMAAVPRPTADQAAFEQLYRLHARSVYGFVYSRLGNADDAEDVTQTTFLNAYRSCVRGRYPQHPESWLIAIARNECRQRYRQMKRRPATERLEDRTILVPGPEGEWTARDIQRALNALPELSRRALVMRELEGRSYAEIGRELELTDSALQALIFRSRRQLREQFEETLSCAEARRSLALRAKGDLGIAGRRALRAHLRSCAACAEREKRPSRREATVQLLLILLPVRRVLRLLGLAGSSGGNSAGAGAGGAVAAKAVAVLAAGAITSGVGYTIAERQPAPTAHGHRTPAARVVHRRTHVAAERPVVVRWTAQSGRWLPATAVSSHGAAPAHRRDGEAEGRVDTPPDGTAPAGDPGGTTVPTPPEQAPAPPEQPPAPADQPPAPTDQPASPPSDPVAGAPTPASAPAAPDPQPAASSQPAAGDTQAPASPPTTGTNHPTGRGKGKPDPAPPFGGPPQRNLNGVPRSDEAQDAAANS
jgi:RNA polymerase sigma factor (sigma-70 family)